MKKLSLTAQIAVALVLAVAIGLLMQNHVQFADTYVRPFGTIFLNLLRFVVVPLVMLSIISGIVSMKDASKVGRLGARALGYFICTTLFAVTLGLTVSTLFKGVFPVISAGDAVYAGEAPSLSFMDQLVSFFPKNIIEPIASSTMMPVIVISLFFGFAMVHVGEKARAAREVLLSFYDIVVAILGYIMAVSPIGIFCMLMPVVAANGPRVLGTYAVLIGVTYLIFLIHMTVVYAGSVRVFGKVSPVRFFREMAPAMLFAFSSASSVATLPYTMGSVRRLGVRDDVGDLVLSLGATVNMDGVAIYLGVASVFYANCCGIDLTMQQYLSIALASTVASIGAPGVPGGSLAMMAMVFASAGIPLEYVAVAAGIDRMIDMGRTTMSVTGDASCAVVMSRGESAD